MGDNNAGVNKQAEYRRGQGGGILLGNQAYSWSCCGIAPVPLHDMCFQKSPSCLCGCRSRRRSWFPSSLQSGQADLSVGSPLESEDGGVEMLCTITSSSAQM